MKNEEINLGMKGKTFENLSVELVKAGNAKRIQNIISCFYKTKELKEKSGLPFYIKNYVENITDNKYIEEYVNNSSNEQLMDDVINNLKCVFGCLYIRNIIANTGLEGLLDFITVIVEDIDKEFSENNKQEVKNGE